MKEIVHTLRHIRRYIYVSVAKTITTALITSRLDYFNQLRYNIASNDILKLQQVQNGLARVVTRSRWFFHSVSLLKSLPWLPVQSRIVFKLLTISYQTLSSREPWYLFLMISLAPTPRELRLSGFHSLSVPRVETRIRNDLNCVDVSLNNIHPSIYPRVETHFGTRAFSVTVPTRWNSLSEDVKSTNKIDSFHHHLKTHLFRLAYPS